MIGTPGPTEIMVLLALGVLLFGKRLPDIMKNLGQGVVEFKKGIHGIHDTTNTAGARTSQPYEHAHEQDYADEVPRFQSDDDLAEASGNGVPKFQATDDELTDDVPKFQPQA